MKKDTCLFLVVVIASAVFISCINPDGTSEKNTTDPTAPPPCIGLWKSKLYFAQITDFDDILLDVDIRTNPDTTYSMIGISDSTKDTLLVHSGYWQFNAPKDTIFLNGTDCRIIDTTLKQLVVRDCQTIPVFIDINNNEWTIYLSDLVPLADQMSIRIPVEILPTLQTLPVIFKKQ